MRVTVCDMASHLPYRTELQRQLPVVCLAAALNKPAGFIQANPLGNGQVAITGSG